MKEDVMNVRIECKKCGNPHFSADSTQHCGGCGQEYPLNIQAILEIQELRFRLSHVYAEQRRDWFRRNNWTFRFPRF
jgi:predicted nucleic-acid-binding Zn-ribbon protein